MPKRGLIRAIARNALMWGVAWGALGTVITSIMRVMDGIPMPNAFGDGLGMGIRIGIVGGLVGALFSAFIAIAYRGKRLREISAIKFALVAALLIGLFIPLFLQSTNLISGQPLVPWSLLFDDMLMGVVFGGIVAGGSLKLAQRAAAQDATDAEVFEDAEPRRELDPGHHAALGSGAGQPFSAPRRAESYERRPGADETGKR